MLEIVINKKYVIEVATNNLDKDTEILSKKDLKSHGGKDILKMTIGKKQICFKNIDITTHTYGISTICNIKTASNTKVNIGEDHMVMSNVETLDAVISKIKEFIANNSLNKSFTFYVRDCDYE